MSDAAEETTKQAVAIAKMALSAVQAIQQQAINKEIAEADDAGQDTTETKLDAALEVMAAIDTRVASLEAATDNLLGNDWNIEGDVLPQDPIEPFNLYELDITSFQVANGGGNAAGVQLRGVYKNVSAGTGMIATLIDGSAGYWSNASTVAGNSSVYLEFDRAAATVSINVATSFPSGDDDTEIMPLWFLPWDTDHIDRDNIIDYRAHHSISGMV